MSDIRFDGRVAVITGAGGGLGKTYALELARRGASVVVNDLGGSTDGRGGSSSMADATVKEITEAGGKAVANYDSVSTPEGGKAIVQTALDNFGKVDIVVNNAGTSRNGPFESLTDDILHYDLEQKLFAAVRLCRLVWPQMKERRWGRIINVLNIGAKAPRPGSAPTSISRAAGMAFTKVLAGEGAPYNVLVNALLVGLIEADQHVQAAKKQGVSIEEYTTVRSKDIPLGRFGRAEEFANLACLLVSDAGSYVTGTAINVDGGRSPVV
jgi:3-oxoacyl-[acyl-carrier protein] reductase